MDLSGSIEIGGLWSGTRTAHPNMAGLKVAEHNRPSSIERNPQAPLGHRTSQEGWWGGVGWGWMGWGGVVWCGVV
eukprot:CAMPEP_0119326546 /NCGR_PEP_ID=MMETSP1333-20130426/68658_1 /TAXON_ID=418940 /ORGANISM="Scyphosphaera apsteinii, Strain RCC1455" /LENGTH=74 /DNA_ID=CAMNT_0007334877 /DNA_START=189 /DNA_END=410 /DNA_ORIENTATION=+